MKLKILARGFALGSMIVVLAGCSTVYEGRYDWQEGWRKAEVIDVVLASEMERPRFYECVRQAQPHQLASTRFAVVRYREMSRTRRRAVPLQPRTAVREGDAVYVRVTDCATQPAPRLAPS